MSLLAWRHVSPPRTSKFRTSSPWLDGLLNVQDVHAVREAVRALLPHPDVTRTDATRTSEPPKAARNAMGRRVARSPSKHITPTCASVISPEQNALVVRSSADRWRTACEPLPRPRSEAPETA